MTHRAPTWPLAAFAIGTSEFVLTALLPQIAQGLRVSIAKGRLLATIYAAGVVIARPR